MRELNAIGCSCGALLYLPEGISSYNGDMPGDDYSIAEVLTQAHWQHATHNGEWFARCGKCSVAWPWPGGGNSRDRRRLHRAFRPIKAREQYDLGVK